jgi:hypothetical protein
MSRKSTFAIAAIAVLGFSAFLVTDASAGGGGHGFRGGSHSRSFHGHSYGRGAFHGGVFSHSSRTASFGRSHYYPRPYPAHATSNHWKHKIYYPGYEHYPHYRPAWWRSHFHYPWSKNHGRWDTRISAYGYGGRITTAGAPGSSGGDATPAGTPMPAAAAASSPAPAPAVATPSSSCDYLLPDEPGCYMAMRPFSTPAGTELRCTKICDMPDGAPPAK